MIAGEVREGKGKEKAHKEVGKLKVREYKGASGTTYFS